MSTPAFPDARVFAQTAQQAAIALECLGKAASKPIEQQLPYLIHAAVLFFVARDQQAFLKAASHPRFEALTQAKPIRQLPTLKQLQAVLAALNAPPDLTDSLRPYDDDALGVTQLHAFRDAIVQHGVPVDADIDPLISAALQGWLRLFSLSSDTAFVTVR